MKLNNTGKVGVNIYSIFLFILLTLNVNVFYLYNSTKSMVAGLKIDDICLLLSACFMVVTLFFCRQNRSKFYFSIEILFVLLMACISAYAGTKSYEQPFVMGFRPQRHWIMMMLMYFPIEALLSTGKMTKRSLLNVLYLFCKIYICVTVLQFILSSKIIFTYVLSSERYDSSRFYFEDCYVMFLSGYTLFRYMQYKNKQDLFWFIMCVFLVTMVIKSRMASVALIMSLLTSVFLSKGTHGQKLFRVIVVAFIAMIVFQSDFVQEFLDDIMNSDKRTGTSYIRRIGREFYINSVKAHPLSGFGKVNTDWVKTTVIAKTRERIFAVDNGMYGMAFYYGLLGVIWWIWLTLKSGVFSLKVFINNGDFTYICYLLTTVLGFVSAVPNCFEATMAFPIFLALVEYEIKDAGGIKQLRLGVKRDVN